jgi:transposase-like protein
LIEDEREGLHDRAAQYLNYLVEQDHQPIKQRAQPMLGFKTFRPSILIAIKPLRR